MSTVSELLTWATHEDALKAYLGVSGTAQDARLQLWLGAMTEIVDLYLGADFTTLPSSVELAVYLAIDVFRQRRKKDGLGMAVTASLTEVYKSAFASDAALQASRSLLRPHKCGRWLDGR